MAGSSFQPPISLNPEQDPSQQTAFINQNFQNLAAVLEADSFRVAASGTTSITAPASGNSNTVSIAHNLGFVPTGIFYVNNSAQYVPLPWFVLGASGGVGVGAGIQLGITVQAVDATNLTFQISNFNTLFNGNVYPIKYYLLQETAATT